MANYIVFDSETTNGMDDPICYDIGWSVINDEGETLAERSFVVADVFIHEPKLMSKAFFADKIPQYCADIADGKRTLKRWENIRKALATDCKLFNVVAIMAHNMRFDYRSTAVTQRWLTSSKYRYFFPFGVEIWDTLKMARQTFGKNEDYKNFCKAHDGYTLKNGAPRLTAEILYRYLTKNDNFEEVHCGLDDTRIEKEIFRACLAMNPDIEKRLWND